MVVAGSMLLSHVSLPYWIGTVWVWVAQAVLTLFAAINLLVGLSVSFRKSAWRGWLFTAAGAVVVLAILAIVVPLFNDIGSRARISRAQTDVRALAAAVSLYKGHMGRLPATLDDLTHPATNPRGETVKAFIEQLPSVFGEPYRYEPRLDGTFTISAAVDGVTVKAP